ncbi:MAG: TonB system transporter ExbD [Candidatus Tokpelaia hoelldobleri]|uniref:Biopolymer transport protein ExbD n=1 Tax=Candidatus Tokpelaia hoelldobleri TaxID=1902579 RepID=A0A1U9JT82_9HYPH|nr:MAG: TonB system transporter ExbD [Candidatus Tokpelaia hoelldoblerii]
MAAKLGSDNDDLEMNHEINVTPFIDVILVLLIIFMVAAPLATSDIAVQLPSSAAPATPQPDKPVYVSLKPDGALYVGEKPVLPEGLGAELHALTGHKLDSKIFIRADRAVDYGAVMTLLNTLREAGYLKLGLVGLEKVSPAPAR